MYYCHDFISCNKHIFLTPLYIMYLMTVMTIMWWSQWQSVGLTTLIINMQNIKAYGVSTMLVHDLPALQSFGILILQSHKFQRQLLFYILYCATLFKMQFCYNLSTNLTFCTTQYLFKCVFVFTMNETQTPIDGGFLSVQEPSFVKIHIYFRVGSKNHILIGLGNIIF